MVTARLKSLATTATTVEKDGKSLAVRLTILQMKDAHANGETELIAKLKRLAAMQLASEFGIDHTVFALGGGDGAGPSNTLAGSRAPAQKRPRAVQDEDESDTGHDEDGDGNVDDDGSDSDDEGQDSDPDNNALQKARGKAPMTGAEKAKAARQALSDSDSDTSDDDVDEDYSLGRRG